MKITTYRFNCYKCKKELETRRHGVFRCPICGARNKLKRQKFEMRG